MGINKDSVRQSVGQVASTSLCGLLLCGDRLSERRRRLSVEDLLRHEERSSPDDSRSEGVLCV